MKENFENQLQSDFPFMQQNLPKSHVYTLVKTGS